MSLSDTMGSTKPLIIVILLSIYIQNILCKDLDSEIKPANDLLNKQYPLATKDRDLRGVLDQIETAAEEIKNRALASWNYLKRVADSTRDEILKWVNSARQYAYKLEKSLADEMKAWRNRLENVITFILGAGEDVQKCLIDEGETIGRTLTDILSHDLPKCLTDKTSKLQPIKGKQEKIAVNDTLFIADLDRKLDACKADKANYEECLNTVGDLVSEDIEEKHNEIQNTSIELRGLVDNIRESMVYCAERNIAEAAYFLASEVREIVDCAMRRRGINKSILE